MLNTVKVGMPLAGKNTEGCNSKHKQKRGRKSEYE